MVKKQFFFKRLSADFFSCGNLINMVFAKKLETLKQLNQTIRDEINEISAERCENIIKTVLKKAHDCEATRSVIVFHTLTPNIRYTIY